MSAMLLEPHLKGGFSERKGYKSFSSLVQIDSLTSRTRNLLYTSVRWYFEHFEHADILIEYVYIDIFSLVEEDIPKNSNYRGVEYYDVPIILRQLRIFFEKSVYNEIFDFLEALIKYLKNVSKKEYKDLAETINKVFEGENVNYRIVDGIITDLTSEIEIKSIDDTLKTSYDVVNKHFQNALELLYHSKDYGNSIKESISAVEAMCQIITGNEKATLGQALDDLKGTIHPALRGAFDKLYGYTSDANGIRHANGLGEGDSTVEEARYMIVSCSAFINYLKEKFEEKDNKDE